MHLQYEINICHKPYNKVTITLCFYYKIACIRRYFEFLKHSVFKSNPIEKTYMIPWTKVQMSRNIRLQLLFLWWHCEILLFKLQRSASSLYKNRTQVIYKPHCHHQNFSPLAKGVYLIAIINKTLLRNGNCPIMNLNTRPTHYRNGSSTYRGAQSSFEAIISAKNQFHLVIPILRQFSGSYRWVLKPSTSTCQAVVRRLSGSCQTVVRQLSGNCQNGAGFVTLLF